MEEVDDAVLWLPNLPPREPKGVRPARLGVQPWGVVSQSVGSGV